MMSDSGYHTPFTKAPRALGMRLREPSLRGPPPWEMETRPPPATYLRSALVVDDAICSLASAARGLFGRVVVIEGSLGVWKPPPVVVEVRGPAEKEENQGPLPRSTVGF